MPTHAAIVIVAWKKLSRRSQLLAKALNAKLWFFSDSIPYVRATFKTLRSILSQKPRIVVTQLPQGPLLLEALVLRLLVGCKVVADVHTGFLLNTDWKGKLLNAPFVKLLSKADLVVAHNEPQLSLMPPEVARDAIVVFDPWYFAVENCSQAQAGKAGYIVFPASFASDEPLEEIINAVTSTSVNVKMYVTGNWKRQAQIRKIASDRVVFTGFLPSADFNSLLAGAAAIVTGTKREYTSLMSAWEAVAYDKPLALTDTRTLKSLFGKYAIFYDWRNSRSIVEALEKALKSKPNPVAREELKARTAASVELLKQKLGTLASS